MWMLPKPEQMLRYSDSAIHNIFRSHTYLNCEFDPSYPPFLLTGSYILFIFIPPRLYMKQERKSGALMRTDLLTSCATEVFPSFARVSFPLSIFYVDAKHPKRAHSVWCLNSASSVLATHPVHKCQRCQSGKALWWVIGEVNDPDVLVALVDYKNISNKTLQESIESEMSGNLEKLLVAVGEKTVIRTFLRPWF